MITFATEEEKDRAIQEFDERTGDLDKLEEIMEAEIQKPEPGDLPVEDVQPVQSQPDIEKPEAEPVETVKPEGDGQDVNSEIEALKKIIEEKNAYIKEQLSSIGTKVEPKLETVTKEDRPKVVLKESRLKDLMERKAKLAEKYPEPEDQLDAEYLKEMNKIQNDMFEEMSNINHNIGVVQSEANRAAMAADNFVSKQKQEEARLKALKAKEIEAEEMKQVQAFADKNPEFKLSKKFSDVDVDFKNYQEDVAKVYFGRKPINNSEINEAMSQLRRGSPGLTSRLNAAGVKTELTEDFKKYLALCEGWDSWAGIRPDPLTNKYNYDENGNIKQLTRYDPQSGQYVPDTFPSFEAAMNDKIVREGYYMRKIVAAKIKGAKDAMSAMSQRDNGAVELGANETHGGSMLSKDEAFKRINDIDPRMAATLAMQGDHSLINEYNKLATLIEWPTVDDIA